jgi:hypothetical protein
MHFFQLNFLTIASAVVSCTRIFVLMTLPGKRFRYNNTSYFIILVSLCECCSNYNISNILDILYSTNNPVLSHYSSIVPYLLINGVLLPSCTFGRSCWMAEHFISRPLCTQHNTDRLTRDRCICLSSSAYDVSMLRSYTAYEQT